MGRWTFQSAVELRTVTLGSWWFKLFSELLCLAVSSCLWIKLHQLEGQRTVSHITITDTQMSVTVLWSLLTIRPEKVLSKHVSEASSVVKNTLNGFTAYSAPWKAAMQCWFKTIIPAIAWPTFSRYPCTTVCRLPLKLQTVQVSTVFFRKVKSKGFLMHHSGFAFKYYP